MTKQEILEILNKFKKDNSNTYGIINLGLFGSVARNENNELSDIDIFLETETPNPFFLVDIKEKLTEILKKDIDIVRLRENMNPFLKSRIKRDCIYV